MLLAASAFLASACGDAGSADDPGDASAAGSEAATAPAQSVTPSFDCSAASGEIEELICESPDLASLDLRLDSVWQSVEGQMNDGGWPESERNLVRAEQRGWIEGRNECWMDAEPQACATDLYTRRIVTLQAQFGLVEVGEPTFWACEGNRANEFVLSFAPTDPPTVRVERGDQQEVMVQTPAASGGRYLGTFGKEVWVQGDEGRFVWPQTDTLSCALQEGG